MPEQFSDFGYTFAYLAKWFQANILDLSISFFGVETSLGAILFWTIFGGCFLRYIRLWME